MSTLNTDHPFHFKVSMRDIDIYGHVHNSVYLDYCEDSIVEFLRARDILGHFRHKSSGVAYHVKKAGVTFSSPLNVDDFVMPTVKVSHLGRTSMAFHIELFRQLDGVLCATGEIVWVCVDLEGSRPTPIPDTTRAVLEATS